MEAYAALSVIYEFHGKKRNFKNGISVLFIASKRDPETKPVNRYIDRVREKNKWNSKSAVEKTKKSISSAVTSSTSLGDILC
jgi:hypothetical protein